MVVASYPHNSPHDPSLCILPSYTHYAPIMHPPYTEWNPPLIHLVTLQWSNMAMENGPFIVSVDDLHIETLDFPVGKLLDYRRIGLEWLKAHSPTKCWIPPLVKQKHHRFNKAMACCKIHHLLRWFSQKTSIDIGISYNDSDSYPALYWNSKKRPMISIILW